MNNAYCFRSALAAWAICLASSTLADEVADQEKLPPGATVLDPDLMMYSWPYPIISPDGQWIAYISKGFVCVCNVADPEPRRLFEVPNTWTHFLAQPEQAHAKGVFHETHRGMNREERRAVLAKITSTVHGLRWTYDSDGIVFSVQSRGENPKNSNSDTWHVSLEGAVINLSHVDQNTKTLGFGSGILTRDRKFLVSPRHKRPLIWEVTTNKPHATCFHNLTPSSTSGRWIGVEKDTRQLVITDEEFEIVKRFEAFQPAQHGGLKLNWSPDEQFLIWRNQIGFDHYSNWEGFWMDLQTGEKRELSGQFMNQQFSFSGRDGEFIAWGVTGERNKGMSGAHSTGAYLTIFSGKDEPVKDIWRIKQPYHVGLGYPPVRLGLECERFAIRLPKPPTGSSWHLMNREGKTWQFPGEDFGKHYDPPEIVGFADDGKVVVGCNGKRMFSIPVATIMNGMP